MVNRNFCCPLAKRRWEEIEVKVHTKGTVTIELVRHVWHQTQSVLDLDVCPSPFSAH